MAQLFQQTSQLISILAIAVYLAAAFLPCEPTPEERSALAVSLAMGGKVSHAAAVQPSSIEKAAHGGHSAHGAHGGHSGHGGHSDHQGHSDQQGHGEHETKGQQHGHGHGQKMAAAHASTSTPSSASVLEPTLALKAKCVCGCEQTRSSIGGGAARLGSVVLAAKSVELAPAQAPVPEDRVLSRWVETHFDDDPVPI